MAGSACMRRAARRTRSPAITISSELYLDEYIAATGIANNLESPLFRTTKLYDRRQDEISLDEVERIVI